jgi:putative NADH-flavin reductase
LKHMYADLERMEQMVKTSDLTWTIMRPPRLTDGARTGKYRLSINDMVKNGLKISRADVADFMLSNLDNKDIFGKTVELGY